METRLDAAIKQWFEMRHCKLINVSVRSGKTLVSVFSEVLMGRILQTDDPDKLYQRGRPVMLRAAGPAVDAVEDDMLAAAHDLSQLRASLAQCGVSAVAYSGPDGASPMAMMCHSGPASPTWGGGGGATPPAFQYVGGGAATPPVMDLGNSPAAWSSLPMSLAAFAAAAGVTPMAAGDEPDGWVDVGDAAAAAAVPAPSV